MTHYDFILSGGGLAGLSLAYHLINSPLRERSILIADKDTKRQNDRTWCFWVEQPTLFDEIAYRVWRRLRFVGDEFAREFDLAPYRCQMIRGLDFYDFTREKLSRCANVAFVHGNNALYHVAAAGEILASAVSPESAAADLTADSRFLQRQSCAITVASPYPQESAMPPKIDQLYDLLLVPPGKKISLQKDYDPNATGDLVKKKQAQKLLADGIQLLAEQQNMLYAQNNFALLIILQAMDAAGKDGVIKHVMSGVNPQGTQVYSFKAPSAEELDHTYLWRNFKALPERGRIGIFNRSYYEEVLVARVHPEILERQQLPPALNDKSIWKRRFEEINHFEEYLVNNGTIVLKFFLNVSKEEQKKRFLERIDRPEKNWKFSAADAQERRRWDDYQAAYEDVLNHTSTGHAPWYVVPADHKWFSRLAVGAVILQTLRDLKLAYPTSGEAQKQELLRAKELLESET